MPYGVDETDANPFTNSLVQVRIGNKTYDARYEKSCKTCTHPARMEIESALVMGDGYRQVARTFSSIEWEGRDGSRQILPEINHQSIRNHCLRGHMPLSAAALRQITEDRTHALGLNYEEMADRYVDHYTVARAIVQKGHERLVQGELEPDLRETLAAAKLLKEIEDAQQTGLDVEMWNQAMVAYFEIARELMPPDMWAEFTRRLRENEVLQQLAAKQQQAQALER